MLAVIDWTEMLNTALAVAGLAGLIAAALRWVFAPRLREIWRTLTAPLSTEIEGLKESNSREHVGTASKIDQLGASIAERWDRHEERHDVLERDIGRLTGHHEAALGLVDHDDEEGGP